MIGFGFGFVLLCGFIEGMGGILIFEDILGGGFIMVIFLLLVVGFCDMEGLE